MINNLWSGIESAVSNIGSAFGNFNNNSNNNNNNANSYFSNYSSNQSDGFDWNNNTNGIKTLTDENGNKVDVDVNALSQGDSGFNWGGLASGASQVAGTYLDFLNTQTAQDSLDFTKNAWQQNFDQSTSAYNRQVERQDSKEAALGNEETLGDRVNGG